MADCDKFGFFNGVMGIEQTNWANYWRGVIPDGVIAEIDNEMEVYAVNAGEGMMVRVKTGQAMVDNHRAWITTEKTLAIPTADATYSRIDLVVLRATYGNKGASTISIEVKEGTPNTTPQTPTCVKVTGETYEIPLASVLVNAGDTNILPAQITDLRFVFRIPYDTTEEFSGSSITCLADREYRNGTNLDSLTVNLPINPHPTFMTSVNFSSSTAFTSVTVKRGLTTISGTSNLKLKGDALSLPQKRYNLVFYWDGSYYWCVSAAV